MKYKKIPIKGHKVLNMYPVYVETVYDGHEPFKLVGIRETQVELKSVSQVGWFDDDEVFVVSSICEELLKPSGCQERNVYCCGGGTVINKHVSYWNDLIIKYE